MANDASRLTVAEENEAQFRALFEQAAVGMAQVALDGSFLRVNQRLCEIVGYTREELVQTTFLEMTHPDDMEADAPFASEVIANKLQTVTMEKRYLRKNGSIVPVDLTVSLAKELPGEPNYFIAVVTDITARKAAEQGLLEKESRLAQQFLRVQRLENIGILANGISHDLSNILAPITMASSMLEDDLPQATHHKLVASIYAAAQRGSDIVMQVLTFAVGEDS